jgi:polyribonucleotide 5'-hydroxyl-kinase
MVKTISARTCLPATTMSLAPPPSRHITLEKLHEFRFELEKDEAISIRLNGGSAEVFGFELAVGVDYPFGNECRAAVFTFHGAQIEIGV